MIQTKTNAMFLLVAISTLGAVGITTAIISSATPAHAGVHINTQGKGVQSNNVVGSPHYASTTGKPQGSTTCNPKTGNPHSNVNGGGPAVTCIPTP